MDPGLCRGVVWHERSRPVEHSFRYDVAFVWIDPDRPEHLTDRHWAWSTRRFHPAQIRRSDYGRSASGPLGEEVREDLTAVLGGDRIGSVRMLTQARRWGWLFNPITIYLGWARGGETHKAGDGPSQAAAGSDPIGAVLEVTNTPWKERHRYALALTGDGSGAGGTLVSEFDKALHVSPFLGSDLRYRLGLGHDGGSMTVTLDVIDGGPGPILRTGLTVHHQPVAAPELSRALIADVLPTHRVSAGIHHQAARLWRKGVPFVAHPKRKGSNAVS
jgi:DUF1365 family protein